MVWRAGNKASAPMQAGCTGHLDGEINLFPPEILCHLSWDMFRTYFNNSLCSVSLACPQSTSLAAAMHMAGHAVRGRQGRPPLPDLFRQNGAEPRWAAALHSISIIISKNFIIYKFLVWRRQHSVHADVGRGGCAYVPFRRRPTCGSPLDSATALGG